MQQAVPAFAMMPGVQRTASPPSTVAMVVTPAASAAHADSSQRSLPAVTSEAAELLPTAAVSAELSSIIASPLSQFVPENLGDPEQEDILGHCRDTARLVNQLAAALRGLEADVNALRQENKTLRKTLSHGAVRSTLRSQAAEGD